MLRSVKEIQGLSIKASDGEIGKVHEFLFDDVSWNIRYIVVDSGTWLNSRLVLLSPNVLGKPDFENKLFTVNLTRERVQNSPLIDTDKPVSRQHEIDLHNYYGWPYYWSGIGAGMPGAVPFPPADFNDALETGGTSMTGREQQGDPHLRSTREVIDYKIQANDDDIGNVEDFIVDDDIWSIRYMVVDTGNWLLPGKKVLIALPWIKAVEWSESKVFVDLTTEQVKNSPEYDADTIINREFETSLYEHYHKPKYWANE